MLSTLSLSSPSAAEARVELSPSMPAMSVDVACLRAFIMSPFVAGVSVSSDMDRPRGRSGSARLPAPCSHLGCQPSEQTDEGSVVGSCLSPCVHGNVGERAGPTNRHSHM